MKKIIYIIVMCGISGSILAMHYSNDSSAEIEEFEKEKEWLFTRLIQGKPLERTVALATLGQRYCGEAPWQEVEEKIVAQLLHRDLYADLVYHPALMRLIARSVKFKLRKNDDLVDFKQDLFCIDRRATAATEAVTLNATISHICKRECDQADDAIRVIIKNLQLLPQYVDSEDSY